MGLTPDSHCMTLGKALPRSGPLICLLGEEKGCGKVHRVGPWLGLCAEP